MDRKAHGHRLDRLHGLLGTGTYVDEARPAPSEPGESDRRLGREGLRRTGVARERHPRSPGAGVVGPAPATVERR